MSAADGGGANQAAGTSISSEEPSQPVVASAAVDGKNVPLIEKTISCVSCRRRKLKCDRAKPRCGTCARLHHDCEYPERRRNVGSRRRNMKELEARLAQVETKLVSESKAPSNGFAVPHGPDGNLSGIPLDINVNFGDESAMNSSFDIGQQDFSFSHPTGPSMPDIQLDDFFSHEVISLGLQEPLPSDEIIDDLHRIYFDKIHPSVPMMHRYRYFAAMNLAPNMRPPICLRYSMWALAASVSKDYLNCAEVFYERARRYIQEDEMKGFGESFVTLYHAQCWHLIATYEAKYMLFPRAWMSTGRCIRMAHMMGLQRLDGQGLEVKQILSPAKDWIDLEERRRTFWAGYYGDRWASAGTGWPMLINESEIMTNLPASEESFEQGIMEETISLQAALTPDGAAKISTFAGVIIACTLFGQNFTHLHKSGSDERPEDLTTGEFWKRHRKMDNMLSNTFMFLPDHLRLPTGLRDMNVVFLNMNIHTSTICLHQAAISTAERNGIEPNFIQQSKTRCYMAAEEITNIMRLVSHRDASTMQAWTGFCLYIAAGVFVQDQRSGKASLQTKSNLEFLISALKALAKCHMVTGHFATQLELDILSSGIEQHSTIMNGINPRRQGIPTTVQELRSFQGTPKSRQSTFISADDAHHDGSPLLAALPTRSREYIMDCIPSVLKGKFPSPRGVPWIARNNHNLETSQHLPGPLGGQMPSAFGISPSPATTDIQHNFSDGSSSDQGVAIIGTNPHTPSTSSSTPNNQAQQYTAQQKERRLSGAASRSEYERFQQEIGGYFYSLGGSGEGMVGTDLDMVDGFEAYGDPSIMALETEGNDFTAGLGGIRSQDGAAKK